MLFAGHLLFLLLDCFEDQSSAVKMHILQKTVGTTCKNKNPADYPQGLFLNQKPAYTYLYKLSRKCRLV